MSGEAVVDAILTSCLESRPLMGALFGSVAESRADCFEHGVEHCLPKPPDLSNLISLIS